LVRQKHSTGIYVCGGCEAVDFGSTMLANHILLRDLGSNIIAYFTEVVGQLIGN